MAIYDDKTLGIIKSGRRFFIDSINKKEDAVFKASYIIGSDLRVDGKITASFDLIVLGDIKAKDLDVKGNLICIGYCDIEHSITVQGKLLGNGIHAKHIEVHDDVVAQEIDSDVVNVDGNIIVGQTLAIETSAECGQKILCGETAFGSGTISAYEILTGDELDMDGGTTSIVNPSKLLIEQTQWKQNGAIGKKYAIKNEFKSYFAELRNSVGDRVIKSALLRWEKALNDASKIVEKEKFVCYDLGILLSLIELSESNYFKGWDKISQWEQKFIENFNKMAQGESLDIQKPLTLTNISVGQRVKHKKYGIGTVTELNENRDLKAKVVFDSGITRDFIMDIALSFFSFAEENVLTPEEIIGKLFIQPNGYSELISFLNVLRVYGDKLCKKLYVLTRELLYSTIGIKLTFLMNRIKENGWEEND